MNAIFFYNHTPERLTLGVSTGQGTDPEKEDGNNAAG